jgi:RecA/RadA recombinase
MKKDTDYGKLTEMMAKADPDGSLLSDYNSDTREFISTGSLILNAQISGSMFRGVPSNKIMTIAGDPKTGKSFIVYNTIANAQKMGYYCWLFETENAVDEDRLTNQGIDRNMLRISQPETVEDIIETLVQFTGQLLDIKRKDPNKVPKVLIAIDSLTALNSRKQYQDAEAKNIKSDMGGIAKSMHALYRMLAVRSGKLNMPVICTSHTWDKPIQGTPIRKKTPSTQGSAALYMSSIVIMLSKKIDKDSNREENKAGVITKLKKGIIVTSQIFESRYTRHIPVTFYLPFYRPINPYVGLQGFMSWQSCGIAKGKWDDYVDLVYELVSKNHAKPEDIPGLTLEYDDLKKILAKNKAKHLDSYLLQMQSDGYLKVIDGSIMFTDKVKDRIKDGKYERITDVQIPILNDNINYFVASHSPGVQFSKKELFTSKVFTPNVLETLDKTVAKEFCLPINDIYGNLDMEEADDPETDITKMLDE